MKYGKDIDDLIVHIKLHDDCRFVVLGINDNGGLEHFKCYTYLQCNEIISELKYLGYKNIQKIKMK